MGENVGNQGHTHQLVVCAVFSLAHKNKVKHVCLGKPPRKPGQNLVRISPCGNARFYQQSCKALARCKCFGHDWQTSQTSVNRLQVVLHCSF